jgi:hypothetical protein
MANDQYPMTNKLHSMGVQAQNIDGIRLRRSYLIQSELRLHLNLNELNAVTGLGTGYLASSRQAQEMFIVR